jgi:predicted DNA-binding transcriptional regulator YafY
MSQTERVLRIQQILQERPCVSRQVFLEQLEISPAQFKRDLAFLRDRFQVRIDYDRLKGGYVLTQAGNEAEVQLPGPMYTPREIYALLIMQDLIEQLQPGLLDEHLGPLRERLKLLLGREDLRSDEIRQRIRILHMASRPVEPRFFSVVSHATLTRRRIAIRYYTRTRDEHTGREVSPQRLVFYRGNWYLDAWCHLRQDLRSFAVDAIEDAVITDNPAREVDTQALDAHLGSGYGIFSGAADQQAVLRFEPAAARYVEAERWHAREARHLEDSGHLILKVPYSNQHELVMDILRYGPDVEVLAPNSLKTEVRLRLRDALQKYRSDFSSDWLTL